MKDELTADECENRINELFPDVDQTEDLDEMISEMETVLTSQTKAIKNISKSQTQVLKKIKKWEDIALNGGFKNQEKLQEVRFIGVEFDYQKVDVGQRLLNEALAEGFQPLRDFDRGSGIVMVMAKWGKQNAKPKDKQKRL